MIPAPASAAFSERAVPQGKAARHRRARAMALLVCALVFGHGGYQLARLSVTQWRLSRRLAALTAEREALQHEQQRLQSDPTYVEGLIRSTFKVAKPGEYVILPETPDGSPQGNR